MWVIHKGTENKNITSVTTELSEETVILYMAFWNFATYKYRWDCPQVKAPLNI